MSVYMLLLVFLLICFIAMVIYLTRKIHNIVKDKVSNKFLAWLISLIPLLLCIIGFKIDMVNTVVIAVHLFIFLLIAELIIYLIKKIKKVNIKSYVSITVGVFLTACYLGYGYYLAHHVVETDYTIYSEKELGAGNFRIAQISDSHIGSTMNGDIFAEYMDLISTKNPDILVVTGDFVDDATTKDDMIKSCQALGNVKTKYGVYFVYGNHDKGYFRDREFDDSALREALNKNNVKILEDEYVEITENIVLIGRQDRQVQNRLSAPALTKDISKNKYIIMLDHQPNDYDNEVLSGSDLVLSGHTHGGQVIPLGQIGLLLKANDEVYGMKVREKTTFIVNSGISDWAVKFKTGTKSEYVIIDIKNKKLSNF